MMRRLTLLFALIVFVLLGCRPEESTLSIIVPQEEARVGSNAPTLGDFWDGSAEFILEVADTGLPMGESETIEMDNGHLWSYVHAQRPLSRRHRSLWGAC